MKRLMMLIVAGILLVPAVGWGAVSVPSGWSVYNNHSATGVALYRHYNSESGAYEFVQIVRLNQGARIVLRHGSLFDGVRGYEPMSRTYLNNHWTTFSSSRPNAFSLFNGAFFDRSDCDNVDPVGVVYSLKITDYMWCYGGLEGIEHLGHKMLWKIWGNEVTITRDQDNWQYVASSTAPDAVVGLDETVNKSASSNIQRTFVGCGDVNGNSRYNTVLIYNSSASTQAHAVAVLQQFGADQWMMFDGGGSTMLQCENETIIGTCRAVPQTIGVVAADDIPPSTPTNLSVNPSGCSQTNSFTFDWTVSTDTGGSGLAGYEWNLDGSNNVSPVPSKPFTSSAPAASNYTFFVRAVDGAGNHSGFASIGFCYQPPSGPCPAIRIIPNSCVHYPETPCYPASAAQVPQSLPDLSSQQWASVGQPVRDALKPGAKYSLGFEYQATSDVNLMIGLGSFNPTAELGLVVNQSVLSPSQAGEWRMFWSAPFTVTADQLERFTSLKFLPSIADGFEIRNVRIVAYQ